MNCKTSCCVRVPETDVQEEEEAEEEKEPASRRQRREGKVEGMTRIPSLNG